MTVSPKPVTYADIANVAGVSKATVSIVIRGESRDRNIPDETTQRVLDIARRLHYVPNLAARTLRAGRTGMIGVTFADFNWNWGDCVLRGMSEVLRPANYTPCVAVHRGDRCLARKELRLCVQRRFEAVVCQPVPDHDEAYRELQDAGVPLVFLGDCPSHTQDVSFVAWNTGDAARRVVEHLMDTGRRRIGFVGVDLPMHMTRARYEAYVAALRAARLLPHMDWVLRVPTVCDLDQRSCNAISQIFDDPRRRPDALFASHDVLALRLLEILPAHGIRVPEDVAVAGMGDIPLAAHRGISLTTVREPTLAIGREAARLVLALINGQVRTPVQRRIESAELRMRHTTAAQKECESS